MPIDPDIELMTLDEALKSVMMVEAEHLLPPLDIKQTILFVMAAMHPNKPTQKQIKTATEWAFSTRAQARIFDYVLARKMTLLPQEDGTVKFGGRMLKVDELSDLLAKREAEKLKGTRLLDGTPVAPPSIILPPGVS